MQITIYTADSTGNKANAYYPNRVVVTSAEEMKMAVTHDHVCATYKNYHRSNGDFIESDDLILDCDNSESDDPSSWITPEMFAEMEPDIQFIATPSRHNMIPKDGKSPRPKWHIHLPIPTINSYEEYAALKKAVRRKYPFFDSNALDAARFFFGAECEEVYWQDGWLTIMDVVDINVKDEELTQDGLTKEKVGSGVIAEGTRNSTLSKYAAIVLKRYGVGEKAKELFIQRSADCSSPLPDDELKAIWGSAVRFYNNKIVGSAGYVSPEKFNADFEEHGLKPFDYSDIGEAKVLAREYGEELCFTNATDFLRHDGKRWIESKESALGAVEDFMDLQLTDAEEKLEAALCACESVGVDRAIALACGKQFAEALQIKNPTIYFLTIGAITYKKFVMKYRHYKNLVNVMNSAKPMLLRNIGDLDRDPMLLNTPSGTIDMRKGVEGIRPHEPNDFITKITEVAPGDEGKEIWESALDTFFVGDKNLIRYVQLIVGLAAVGKVYQEHLIIAYGGGANGKSTFWNAIFRVMGDYAGKISADSLTMNCKHNVKPEMAELKGRRLIIASEMEEGMKLSTSIVKQICSTDEIEAEKKYKDPFFFEPSHTLVLYTNHLPKVGANDNGIWRRLIVIPFNAKIEGNSDIKNYADYLFRNAGPYILKWIIEGAKAAFDLGFKFEAPESVKRAMSSYHERNDWFSHFIEDCCEVGKDFIEKSGAFYDEYRNYCARMGDGIKNSADFYSAVEKAGFTRRRKSDGRYVIGVKLKNEFLEE